LGERFGGDVEINAYNGAEELSANLNCLCYKTNFPEMNYEKFNSGFLWRY